MTKKEYIANLNSFITHFQDMIKDYDKGKIHPSFDREQAEKDIETFNAAIQALEQEQKTGHWIDDVRLGYYVSVCSNCNWISHGEPKYCPNCGAKMIEPKGK